MSHVTFYFSLFPHVTFYKTLTSLSTVFIKGHVGFLQLLKWLCRTSFFHLCGALIMLWLVIQQLFWSETHMCIFLVCIWTKRYIFYFQRAIANKHFLSYYIHIVIKVYEFCAINIEPACIPSLFY